MTPPIYEKDRKGYRHLAYLQTKLGFTIKLDLPQLKGDVVAHLYAHGRAWLEQLRRRRSARTASASASG